MDVEPLLIEGDRDGALEVLDAARDGLYAPGLYDVAPGAVPLDAAESPWRSENRGNSAFIMPNP